MDTDAKGYPRFSGGPSQPGHEDFARPPGPMRSTEQENGLGLSGGRTVAEHDVEASPDDFELTDLLTVARWIDHGQRDDAGGRAVASGRLPDVELARVEASRHREGR